MRIVAESTRQVLDRYRGFVRSWWMYYANPLRTRRLACLYAQFIRPGDLCFDIGAHLGSHVSIWLSLDARVVALEPQPLFAAYLKRRFSRDRRVVLRTEAAGSERGMQVMLVSTRTPTLSTLDGQWATDVLRDPDFSHARWDSRLPVNVTTLDCLVESYGKPHFCKIDVEGAEADVLAGLSAALPCLSFEYVPAVMERTFLVIDRLDRLGDYEFNWVPGEGRRLQSAAWLPPAGIRSVMRRLCGKRGSGDIYARLPGK